MLNNSLHKFQLHRLLTNIADNPLLSQQLYFKGGTCAAMLGFLDRFSIDLDFDKKPLADTVKIRHQLIQIFQSLDLKVDNHNITTLFFETKYLSPPNTRNTLKLSVYEDIVKSNEYQPQFLPEINRLLNCQTIETMFANKLVAPIDRFTKYHKLAGRDIYDIHYFFSQGYQFKQEIIEERTNTGVTDYIKMLIDFIEDKVTETTINQDLNPLLPNDKFQKIRKVLKTEVLIFLRNLKL